MGNRNRKLEDSWQEAFHNKEMTPSTELWNNLDAHLANKEAKKYRKGILFYKWVAAAAVLIAFGLGIYSYVGFGNEKTQLADKTLVNDVVQKYEKVIAENGNDGVEPSLSNNELGQRTTISSNKNSDNKSDIASNVDETKGKSYINNKYGNTTQRQSIFTASDVNTASHPVVTVNDERNSLAHIGGRGLTLTTLIHESPIIEIDKVIIFSDDPFQKEPNDLRDVWAGIDFAGGQFNPNVVGNTGDDIASFDNNSNFNTKGVLDSSIETITPGNSYSFNLNVGKKIAKRWMLQSGLSYLNYSSNTTTNTYFINSDNSRTPAFSNLSSTALNDVVEVKKTPDINLNNSLEFISIPIKAGYMVLNKKVSVILLAGISSDFFLKNKVSADDESFTDIVTKGGNDSPYNTVHLNGLMSTQVRYQFSKNYSLTLEPSYTIAINSLTKTDRYATSLPSLFNLGLGLKYHFR